MTDSMADFIKQHGRTFDWPDDHSIYSLHHSIYYPFWLRLKKHSFKLQRSFATFREADNVLYMQTSWVFVKAASQEQIILLASRNLFTLTVEKAGKVKCNVSAVSYTHLEAPFLRYFGEPNKLLFISRMGAKTELEKAFIAKWQRHVNDGGKYSAMIKRLNVLPPITPLALVKPKLGGK